MQLRADLRQKLVLLVLREIGGQATNSLDEVEGLDTTVGTGRWSELEQRTRLVMDHLDLASRVRSKVAGPEQLEDRNSSLGSHSDAITDRDVLESRRPLVSPTTDEEGSELVPDLLGLLRAAKLNSIGSLGVLLPAGVVDDINDVELLAHQGVDDPGNVGLGTNLPLTGIQIREDVEPIDDETGLELDILMVVEQLGVFGGLALECKIETAMVLLDSNHSILKEARGLGVLQRNLLDGGVEGVQDTVGGVEQVENELQTGVRSQMDSVSLVGRSRETRQEMNAGRPSLHDLGKLVQDFRQMVSVPQRREAIHGRDYQVPPVWKLSGGRGDLLQDLQKDGLDAEGDWGACIGRGSQEVGEAGHDADVGLATNGLETLGEDGKTAARNDLASGHQGTIAAVRRVHVTFHIRVAENREAPQRGHGGNRMKTQRGDSRQSDSGSQIFCINAM